MDEDKVLAAIAALEARMDTRFGESEARVRDLIDASEARVRGVIVARAERIENRLNGVDAQLQLNVTSLAGLLEQLTLREQQLGMLQDAIRTGMNAESEQLRSMRKLVVEMQGLINRMQTEIYVLTKRLDEALEGPALRGL